MTPPPKAGAHATPLTAVDDVREVSPGSLVATKLVRADDPYLAGHYPGAPLYPGLFLVETVRQAVSASAGHELRIVELVRLRLLAPLRPGDVVTADIECLPRDDGFSVEATANAAGTPVANVVLVTGRA